MVDSLVTVYSTTTGRPKRVPAHYLDVPALMSGFRKTPPSSEAKKTAKKRAAKKVAAEREAATQNDATPDVAVDPTPVATTPNTPATGDTTKES